MTLSEALALLQVLAVVLVLCRPDGSHCRPEENAGQD